MTSEQKIIRAKVGLLELAKQLGNVSQACKMMGYSYLAVEDIDHSRTKAKSPSPPRPVFVATKPVDFREGMEGLATLVREHMKADPFSGAVYVFRAKRADRIKLVFWMERDCARSPNGSRKASSAGRRSRMV